MKEAIIKWLMAPHAYVLWQLLDNAEDWTAGEYTLMYKLSKPNGRPTESAKMELWTANFFFNFGIHRPDDMHCSFSLVEKWLLFGKCKRTRNMSVMHRLVTRRFEE